MNRYLSPAGDEQWGKQVKLHLYLQSVPLLELPPELRLLSGQQRH